MGINITKYRKVSNVYKIIMSNAGVLTFGTCTNTGDVSDSVFGLKWSTREGNNKETKDTLSKFTLWLGC